MIKVSSKEDKEQQGKSLRYHCRNGLSPVVVRAVPAVPLGDVPYPLAISAAHVSFGIAIMIDGLTTW